MKKYIDKNRKQCIVSKIDYESIAESLVDSFDESINSSIRIKDSDTVVIMDTEFEPAQIIKDIANGAYGLEFRGYLESMIGEEVDETEFTRNDVDKILSTTYVDNILTE